MNRHRDIWRTRARWFAAQFLVIVTGVLVAVGLNGFYQSRQDARNEQSYLALLSRDLRQTTQDLVDKTGFEGSQLRNGLMAYRALSEPGRIDNTAAVSAALGALTTRRTMALREGTYQDLLSTGNLRLIQNRQLRDQIVDFYARTAAEYEIMNKNNSVYVDDLYVSLVIGKGLIKPATPATVTRLAASDAKLFPMLRPGFIDDADYLWSLPKTAPEWAQLKSTLLMRIRIAALSEQYAQDVLTRARALSAALEAERAP